MLCSIWFLENEARLAWVLVKTMGTNDITWGGVPFLVTVTYHAAAIILFTANLYFICCRLKWQQEKNVYKINGFGQARDLNIITWEGKTDSDIILLFTSLSPSCLLYVLKYPFLWYWWKLWVIRNKKSFLHLLDML